MEALDGLMQECWDAVRPASRAKRCFCHLSIAQCYCAGRLVAFLLIAKCWLLHERG